MTSGPASAIGTILLDLDGVVRHFDPEHQAAVEERHGLEPGTLWKVAFEPDLVGPVTTGQATMAAWQEEIGRRVGNPQAVAEWMSDRGTIDHELMAVVDRLRAEGFTVAVLTNGTDAVAAELSQAGVDHRFDAVFNSADIGSIKPDRPPPVDC